MSVYCLAVDTMGVMSVDASSHVVYSTMDADGRIRTVTSAEYHGGRRELASEADADWKNRMVFYTGDEKLFYPANSKKCDPLTSIFDPACRAIRKTHKEVAYNGYGTYRGVTDDAKCELKEEWNAWLCEAKVLKPARLVIESMDKDHTSRSLAPVALASGGFVDPMNAG